MLGLQGPFGKEETAIRGLEGGSVRVAFSRVIKAPLAQPFICAKKVQIVLLALYFRSMHYWLNYKKLCMAFRSPIHVSVHVHIEHTCYI